MGFPVASCRSISASATATAISSSCFVSPRTIAAIATAAATSRRARAAFTAKGISQAPETRTTSVVTPSSFALRIAAATIRSGSGGLNSPATITIRTEVHLDPSRVREPLPLPCACHRRQLFGFEEEAPRVHRVFARATVAQPRELALVRGLGLVHEDPEHVRVRHQLDLLERMVRDVRALSVDRRAADVAAREHDVASLLFDELLAGHGQV